MEGASHGEAPGHTRDWAAMRLAVAWLTHPVSLVAVVVLVVNDHILKDTFGSWWTGKLSDFAGLIFFPALLAVVFASIAPRARFPVIVLSSALATLVGFTWVKATAIGAATASASWSFVAGPSVILRDATDLIALPMVGVAAWVAFRARPRREVLVATFAIPFAVAATVATGAPPDPSATVLEDRPDGAVLVIERAESYGGSGVYELQAGGTWRDVTQDHWEDRPLEVFETTMVACVPAEPDICFRPLAETIGVERSSDGGARWVADWELSEEQMATLIEEYGVNPDYDPYPVTRGVAIAPTAAGFTVIAANDVDGIAVRSEDGTWSRLGWTPFACCDYVNTVDLEAESQTWRSQEALAWWVPAALFSFVLGFAVFLLASPRARFRGLGRVIAGGLLVFLGLAWASLALLINASPAERVPDGGFLAMIVIGNLMMGLVPAFAGTFLLFAAPGKVYGTGLASAAIVSILVAVSVGAASGNVTREGVVAVLTFGVGIGAAVWLERRRRSGPEPETFAEIAEP